MFHIWCTRYCCKHVQSPCLAAPHKTFCRRDNTVSVHDSARVVETVGERPIDMLLPYISSLRRIPIRDPLQLHSKKVLCTVRAPGISETDPKIRAPKPFQFTIPNMKTAEPAQAGALRWETVHQNASSVWCPPGLILVSLCSPSDNLQHPWASWNDGRCY